MENTMTNVKATETMNFDVAMSLGNEAKVQENIEKLKQKAIDRLRFQVGLLTLSPQDVSVNVEIGYDPIKNSVAGHVITVTAEALIPTHLPSGALADICEIIENANSEPMPPWKTPAERQAMRGEVFERALKDIEKVINAIRVNNA